MVDSPTLLQRQHTDSMVGPSDRTRGHLHVSGANDREQLEGWFQGAEPAC